MPLYVGLVTIKSGGKYHPPGTVHELASTDAAALGPGRVRPAPNESIAPPVLASVGDAATNDAPSADASTPAGAEADGASEPDARITEIKAALDLLDPADYVQTGKRAGKPKIKPLGEILGYEPNDAEIEAAMALRDEGV